MRLALTSILSLLMLGCSTSKSPSEAVHGDTSNNAEVQPVETAAEPEPAEPSTGSNVVKLSHVETTISVPVNTQLHYSYKSHASVGYGAKFEIGDPAVLRHVRTDTEYKQSEEQRADKDGADAATATFVFEASSPGSTTLRIEETFRGKTERKVDYTITVVEP